MDKKIVSVTILLPDKLTKIEVSTGFYTRMQNVLSFLYNIAPSEEDAIKMVKSMAEGKGPQNDFEDCLYTVIGLLTEIERCAKDQGNTEPKDVEVPTKYL